ncbi:hypothetical protein BpHYR1_017427 [Brachionus plicatilis]|uniref:Uncharacterized protein n=1 Tax=Brachionus plicatilis TaxID=10195 RepID=A0A3M7RAU6_BRAPC|nr:hypothetical protein BpHYR1_017427 [Brachionus plicatilis]
MVKFGFHLGSFVAIIEVLKRIINTFYFYVHIFSFHQNIEAEKIDLDLDFFLGLLNNSAF